MKKIMFNDKYGLTQAVLEGRKTQTRRLVQDEFFTLQWDVRGDTLVVENDFGDFIDIRNTKFCMFNVGEIVAIAKSYKDCGYSIKQYETSQDSEFGYLTGCGVDEIPMKWPINGYNNKMFVKPELMPHQIRITNVRIERLQDISDEDCLAEGIEFDSKAQLFYCGFNDSTNSKIWLESTSREAYASLIDKVSGKGTWESNPYVFVYDFELVK